MLLFVEALIRINPWIYVIFAITLFEGCLGGLTYVNAFYLIHEEILDLEYREFALGITSVANTIGISLAGAASVGLQPLLQNYQVPFRY